MKKFLVLALIVLALSAFGCVAYADETATPQSDTVTVQPSTDQTGTTATGPSTAATPSTSKIDKNDPLYISLQQKNETRKGLIQQENQVIDSIKSQNKINEDLRKNLALDAKAQNKDEINNIQAQINDAKTKVQPLIQQKASLLAQLSDAVKAKDKTTAKGIRDQISALNQQIKDASAQVKTLRDSLRAAKSQNKSLWDKIKDIRAQIQAVNAQIMQIEADTYSLRASKEKEWIGFYNAISALDLADANTHMDNIINYKTQIINKLNQVLTLKKQIQTILSGLE